MNKKPLPNFGPANYQDVLTFLTGVLVIEKGYFPNQAMLVGIEGPSSSGKTTLATNIGQIIAGAGLEGVVVEGDRFQRLREEGMEVYRAVLDKLSLGEKVPADFPERIWRYDMMQEQLLDAVKGFNDSKKSNGLIRLNGVISSDKMSYLNGDEVYPITRNSIVFVPGMYLRHLDEFDFLLELQVDPEISVRRKIERDKARQYSRPIEITRKMVIDIEDEVTKARRNVYSIKRGMIANMDDFDSVTLKGIY